MPNYRVAVIGRTGRGNYGHGLDVVWLQIPNAQIVAVADENEAGRNAAQKRLGAKSAYADYRQMLQKERPQIVSVADRHLDLRSLLPTSLPHHSGSFRAGKNGAAGRDIVRS